jgi:tellurite resistance protein TehA-like permease
MSTTASATGAPSEGLAGLHPAYFALVMATGIVSIASHLTGIPVVPKVLFALNLALYPLLWLLTALHAAR